jgi:hypothetical protein
VASYWADVGVYFIHTGTGQLAKAGNSSAPFPVSWWLSAAGMPPAAKQAVRFGAVSCKAQLLHARHA